MALKLLSQKELSQKLKTTYKQAGHLKAYLNNETFSLTIKFKHLSEKNIEQNFTEICTWIEELKTSSFDITFQSIAYRSLGKQTIPNVLIMNRENFLKHLSKQNIFNQHINLIEESLKSFPNLKTLLIEKPKLIMEYDKVWKKLLKVCNYFTRYFQPNLYIRELNIEGIDTKFIESHKKVLDLMLSTILDTEVVKLAQNGFEKRYGLKYDLPSIRFRILDESLYVMGLCDISLPLNEFKNLNIACDNIFITENKINGLSFPNIKSSMVIFGLGYGVESLKEVKWLENRKLYYWGDIDTHGFAILSQIRSYFSNIESILMHEEVINNYKSMATEEPLAKRFMGELKYLTKNEENIFNNLKKNSYANEFRLEQERIPMSNILISL
jgi:hypothetical protein